LGTVKIVLDFEVIEIISEKGTYLVLLGFKWVNDNEAIISLKRWEMLFEVGWSKLI
jgi:hypothetical protein